MGIYLFYISIFAIPFWFVFTLFEEWYIQIIAKLFEF